MDGIEVEDFPYINSHSTMLPWTPSKSSDPFAHICPPFLYPWAVEKHVTMNTNGQSIFCRSTVLFVRNLGDLAALLTPN